MEKKSNRFTTVSIPKRLADRTKKFIEKTGFTSLSSFVEYLLREIASGKNEYGKEEKEDLEGVEEKLRRLGYL